MASPNFNEILIMIREYCDKLTEIEKALASPSLMDYHITEYKNEKAIIENQIEKIVLSYGS